MNVNADENIEYGYTNPDGSVAIVAVLGNVKDVKIGEGCSFRNDLDGHRSIISDSITIGKNCEIGSGAVILGGAVIGDNVTIESDVHIGGAVIGDNVTIGRLAYITVGTVIPDGTALRAGYGRKRNDRLMRALSQ